MSHRIVPMPFSEIPSSTEPLTAIRYYDTMHALLEQCHGLAECLTSAANNPGGMVDGLPEALEVLEQYLACALELFECWHDETPPKATEAPDDEAN